ncbi:MAG: bifunctional enoyl-CoA hydratase/phosphate acetyltransferase [Clostridia bacterium]|nr:bifunctional enoyl-CoA hydratase/phosphate acetyltransferase [Clostridia bacterium]
MLNKLAQIEEFVLGRGKGRVAVVAAHDDNVLTSIREVYEKGYVEPILIGDKEKIFRIAEENEIDISRMNIIKEIDDTQCARVAVNMINNGEADILMKGFIQTADLLRVVLDKDKGLRTNRVISHVGIFEVENYPKLLIVTDAGINIAPDLKQKAEIIQNAVFVANKLGIEKPKVAVLSAIEVVNPAMQSTIDAAALSKMAQRGQITNCTVDGPLAMDNAINLDAALHKHIESEVAGDADILVVPNIESGNILVKSLVFLYKAKSCSVFLGAKVPLVITSRAEDSNSKYHSILMGLALR